jgi:mycothiol synthase
MLNWRTITLTDLPALVNLADECDALDGGLTFVNESNSLKERVFPNSELAASIGAFTIDEQLAAVTTINLTGDEKEMRAIIIGQVKPAYRHQGLGKHLMGWSEVQAQNLFTTQRSAKQSLRIATESLTDHAHQLYTAHSFQCIYEALVMRRDLQMPLPNCPFPSGVTLTNWQRELGEQFFQAYHAAFRERPGFPNPAAQEWITGYFENENIKSEWSLLALDGETPAGFVFGSVERPGGYIVQIGVIPEYRGQGLGAALMMESLKRMQAAGITVAQLEVNVNNPSAISVYKQLGFTTIGRRGKYEREFKT